MLSAGMFVWGAVMDYKHKDFVEILDRPLYERGAQRDEIGVVVGVGIDHIIVLTEDFETRECPRNMIRAMNILEVMARMAAD